MIRRFTARCHVNDTNEYDEYDRWMAPRWKFHSRLRKTRSSENPECQLRRSDVRGSVTLARSRGDCTKHGKKVHEIRVGLEKNGGSWLTSAVYVSIVNENKVRSTDRDKAVTRPAPPSSSSLPVPGKEHLTMVSIAGVSFARDAEAACVE